ncbi:hypothetical protein [Endozoicomonas sp. ALB032]|uniref:hypothetical protein n=1 Tax=Endozoicomonas sp. ALB032 TaxID=3403082 RepID=UPI003BB59C07
MNKSQYYLARLIVPVFLLQALNPEAQATQPPLPTDCASLSGQTTGVHQWLDDNSEFIRRRQCVVLTSDPTVDTAQLINQIPENTVILLSSRTTIQPVIPPTGNTLIIYLIDSEIVLKDGQDIIGAADKGFEIVITPKQSYKKQFMVRVGTRDNFQFEKTRSSHIRHVTFTPKGHGYRSQVHAIVKAECYNRNLIIENNQFSLPYWTAVDLDCKEPLDASANDDHPGPGLLFANNLIIGSGIRTRFGLFFAEEGIHINLPAIQNQSKRLKVIGNRFLGRMAEAGEFVLGPGAHLDVFRNRVYISNIGITLRSARRQRQSLLGGFALIRHKDSDSEPARFNLAGNEIKTTTAAITVRGPLELALACNHLRAISPWLQLQPEFSLKSANPLPLGKECPSVMSSSIAMLTPDSTVSRQAPVSTVDMSTPNSTSVMPGLESTVGVSTLNSTSVVPGLGSTVGVSTPNSTSVMPGLESTVGMSAPNSTSVVPGLESTVGVSTPDSTSVMPSPGSTVGMSTPNSTSVMPSPGSTVGMSTPNSTSVMPSPGSTVGMSTPNSTSVMSGLESTIGTPTPNSTFDWPTPYSTVVMPTHKSYTINQIRNTWTAIHDSTANACSGLFNFEGQFFFNREDCLTVAMTHAFFITDTISINSRTHDTVKTIITSMVPTSSAGTNLLTTSGLGIITTLAVLLSP